MTQDLGTSASPTGPSQAEPETVSALRASVPSAESITTEDGIKAALRAVTEHELELRAIREELFLRRRQLEFDAKRCDHPWLGKAVVREVTKRKRRDIWSRAPVEYTTRTERGVVALKGPSRASYRGHSPSPGEVFVRSQSGATAYRFREQDGWQLASAQAMSAGTAETEGLSPKDASAVLAEDAPNA